MRSTLIRCAALGVLATSFAAGRAGASGPLEIGSKKFGDSNDVKMDVIAPGNLQPINATVRQQGNNVVLEVVQGGTTTAKPVEIDAGSCPNPGASLYRLPPFRGNQYQAVVKNAKLTALQDGQHAIAIFGSNGKHRTTYACGTLVKPNLFNH